MRFAKTHWLRGVLTAVSLVLLGLIVGRGCRRDPPPLVIHRPVSSTSPNPSDSPTPLTVEQTYTCGARTKKGTPCSRRVHGPVRCWQHKGAKAMLPPEKLVIKD